MIRRITNYFIEINWSALWKSTTEVLWLTLFAFLPLVLNICIYWLSGTSLQKSLETKVIPGEILSYCLSFIAPSIYLLIKIHGTNYRLPMVKVFFFITFLVYILTLLLYLIAKNNWVENINLQRHTFDPYYKLAVIFLGITILFRIYSTYHGSFSNWTEERLQQQRNFNTQFANRIRG